MLAFTLRRLFWMLVVLLIASFGVFFLVANGGDPLAVLRLNPHTPESVIQARIHLLHLNDPLFVRYWIWLTGIFHGNLGNDISGVPVAPQLLQAFPVTLRMVVPATIIAVVVAIGFGIWAAVRQGRTADNLITFGNFLWLSVPVFVIGLTLKDFVALPVNHAVGQTVLYTIGDESPLLTGSWISNIPNYIGHAVLPVFTLVLISYAPWAIYQRSSMLEVLDSDYVRLARAKGISPRRVLFRHILRNALIPVTTVVALDFAAILGGAVVTETIFNWNGIGLLFFTRITELDFNVVQAYLLLTATFVVVMNFLADIIYGILDPRIRLA